LAAVGEQMWVCIGHSHSYALSRAATKSGWGLDSINFWETGEAWQPGEGGTSLRPDLAMRVEQGSLVLSTTGGVAHYLLGLVEHRRPFDFVLPSEPALPTDGTREIVPAEAVRAKLTEAASMFLEMFPAIVRTAKSPVIQLEPPPPLADLQGCATPVPWHLFPDQPQLVAPKWVRYKLWRMHSEVIATACAKCGIGYMRVPGCVMDEEGFLDPRFDEDGFHANTTYGAAVLEVLRRTT
jgi:hypothetical protein